MNKNKFIKSYEVPSLIKDNSVVGVSGFVGAGVAEEIHIEMEKSFLQSQKPQKLTIIYSAGIGDGKSKGLNHYAHENMVKRIIGGHWGLSPKLQPLVTENKIEAYNFPQGVISQLLRDSVSGKPRTITHVGL